MDDGQRETIIEEFCNRRPEVGEGEITDDFEQGWTIGFYSAIVAFWGEDAAHGVYEECLAAYDDRQGQ